MPPFGNFGGAFRPERTRNRPQTGGGLELELGDPGGVAPPTGGGLTAGLSPSFGTSGTVAGNFVNPFENVFSGGSSFVDQFLNPTLVADQQRAIDAIRKTAAARGLSGGAVESRVQDAQQKLLAGNRVQAVQGLRGEARSRIDAFQQQIGGFLGASRGGQGRLNVRGIEESLFGGLTSFGLGDFVKSEAFRRVGGEGGRQNTFNPGGPLQEALDQIFRPTLAGQPEIFRERLGEEGALNRAQRMAAGRVGRLLESGLDTLENEALDLEVFGQGAGLLGEFDPGAVLGADVSQFAGLFDALGFNTSPSDLLQG